MKATDSVDKTTRSLLAALDDVLPRLFEHASDVALRDEWMGRLSDASPPGAKIQPLVFLAVLVNEIGPEEKLAGLVDELRRLVEGTVHEGLIKLRLERAGVRTW